MIAPGENELTFKLPDFEGPLDLLLHLIKEMKVDIFDIPIAEITEQYLRYLDSMQELKLDVAGDYLLMAATLLEIKSRLLLPKKEIEFTEDFYEEGEDPRESLVQQLIEYKQFQGAAKALKELEQERGLYFTKNATDLEELQHSVPLSPGEVSATDLIAALQKMYQKLQKKKPLQAKMGQEQFTVEQTMRSILEKFDSLGATPQVRIPFAAFFEVQTKSQVVNTFLAMLELVKEREINFMQEEVYGDIYLIRIMGVLVDE
ncbi:prokaryotic chromosome segregation/condensation protein scpa [Trichococcus palustris]|jgi:segregation and condensation protein A|uniref:Segregation and condensation protein A n=1 Tax=Trichococcus palustris TaxID=140314 RepID=A0A143Y747_9LACT|nr:segregation/condensation protein A [Trichococcus palustris]CZQ83484.1 prokaryotic chromosome segregation/condensation protein scpa [Trichococcus palustris]SFK69948.1 condensin subunit ScpA [Trichococcus palustris]